MNYIKLRIFHCFPLAVVLLLASPANSKIVRVADTGDGSDGQSWETAYNSVGIALANSDSGDRIWVKGGTYRGFRVDAPFRIYGGFQGVEADDEFHLRNWIANETIFAETQSGSIITFALSESALDGFTITGGESSGLRCIDATPTIRNCVIRDNTYRENIFGGGLTCSNSTITLENCSIRENVAFGRAGFGFCVSALGGGAYLESSTATIVGCTISDNHEGGPRGIRGGGVAIFGGSALFVDCRVVGNEGRSVFPTSGGAICDNRGGGVYCEDASLGFSECVFSENHSDIGAGASLLRGSAVFRNCQFSGNSTGSTLSLAGESGMFLLENCTLGKNEFTEVGSRVVFWVSPSVSLSISNSIVWDNTGSVAVISDASEAITVIHSNLEGGWEGPGNIDLDPGFVDPDIGDFHLLRSSPCIDAGTDTELTVDLDGNPRPIDVIGRGTEGPGAYDMGAFEFQLSPADLDANGYVNSKDLILFQDQWHESGSGMN